MIRIVLLLAALMSAVACGSGSATPATPPVAAAPRPPVVLTSASLVVPKLVVSTDPAHIAQGEALFAAKGCVACHKLDGTKLVGPSLKGVTARRDVEWIEKMILHPDVMLRDDPTARKMLAEHMTQMPAQGVDPEKELPHLLAFLKAHES